MVFYKRHPLAERIFGGPKPASKPTYFPEFRAGVVDPPSPKATYFPEFEASTPAGVRGLVDPEEALSARSWGETAVDTGIRAARQAGGLAQAGLSLFGLEDANALPEVPGTSPKEILASGLRAGVDTISGAIIPRIGRAANAAIGSGLDALSEYTSPGRRRADELFAQIDAEQKAALPATEGSSPIPASSGRFGPHQGDGYDPAAVARAAQRAEQEAKLTFRKIGADPAGMVGDLAGNSLPFIGAGRVGRAFGIAEEAMAPLFSVPLEAGSVKQNIAQTVMDEPEQNLLSDSKYAADVKVFGPVGARRRLAERAQSYLENPGLIALGAIEGYILSRAGADAALMRAGSGGVKAGLTRGVLKNTLVEGGKEAITEFPQEMFTTWAGNKGAASGGANIDPMKGVIESGIMAAATAGPSGGIAGAVDAMKSARARASDSQGGQVSPAPDVEPVSDDPVEILKALARGGARPVPTTLQPTPAVPTAPAEFAQEDLEGAAQLPRTVNPSLEASSSAELASAVSPGSARSIAEATRARHAEAKRRAAAFRPATPAEAEQYQADAVMALQDALTRGADDEAVVTYVLDSVALGEKRGGFNTPEAALKAAGFSRPKPIVEALKAKHGAGVFDVAREEKVSEVKQAEALDKAAKKQKTAEDIYYANPAVQERITASQYANILAKAVAAKSMKPLVDEAGLSPAKAADALALGTREASAEQQRADGGDGVGAGFGEVPESVQNLDPEGVVGLGPKRQATEVPPETRSVAKRVDPVLRAEQVLPAGETEAVVGSGRSDVVPPQVRGRVPDGGEGGDVQGESVSDSAVADYRARIDQRIREIKRKEPNLPHRIIAQRVNQEFGTDNRLGKGREALGRRIVDEVLKGQENPKTTDRGNYPGGPVSAMVNSQKDTGPKNDPERNLYQPDDPFAAAREANQPEVDAGFTRAEAWLRQKFGVPETLPEPQNDPRFGNAEPKQVTEAELENAVLDARGKRVQGQPAVAPTDEARGEEQAQAVGGAQDSTPKRLEGSNVSIRGGERETLVADQAETHAESPQGWKVGQKVVSPGLGVGEITSIRPPEYKGGPWLHTVVSQNTTTDGKPIAREVTSDRLDHFVPEEADQAAQGAESVPQRLKVQAKNLQPGDVARGSGETILAVAKQFVAKDETQRGKVEVQLRSAKGKVRTAYWNPSTEISVDRGAPQAQTQTPARPERRGDTEMRAAVSSEQAKDTGESTREIIDRLTKERDQARKERDTDTLTGVESRAAGEESIKTAKALAKSDMAGLKFYNESFGDAAGDVVLDAAGRAYLKALKKFPEVRVSRRGGDEFETHGPDQKMVEAFTKKVESILRNAVVTFKRPDGSIVRAKGLRIDHGTAEAGTDGVKGLRERADKAIKTLRVRQEAAGKRAPRGDRPYGLVELPEKSAAGKQPDRNQPAQRVEKPYPGLEGLDATQTAALEFDAQKLKRELPNVEESTGRPTLWDVIEPFYFNDLYGYVGRNTLDELTEAHLPAAERSPRARLIAQKALPGGRPSARLKPHEIGLTKDGRLKSEASVPKLGTVYKTKGALDEQIRTLIDLGWFRDGSTAGDLAEALIADRPFYHPDGADSESKVISAEDSQLKEAAQAVAEETGIKVKDIVPVLIDNNGKPKEIAILKALVKLDPFGTQEQAERAAQDGDFMDAQEPVAPAADDGPNPWDEPVAQVTPSGAPVNRDDYISTQDYENALKATYFTEVDGEATLSSRTTPQTAQIPPIGTWRQSNTRFTDGHDIEELVEIPVDMLMVTEDTGPGKFQDVKRYAEWWRDGIEPPPIDVIQTDKGTLNTQGHRRLLAAKALGKKTIKAWVSWTVPSNRDAKPMVGLTYELAKSGVEKRAIRNPPSGSTIQSDDAKRLEALKAELSTSEEPSFLKAQTAPKSGPAQKALNVEKTEGGQQMMLPGGVAFGSNVERKRTEGREAQGPLFQQEAEAEKKADAAKQQSLVSDAKYVPTTIAEAAARMKQKAAPKADHPRDANLEGFTASMDPMKKGRVLKSLARDITSDISGRTMPYSHAGLVEAIVSDDGSVVPHSKDVRRLFMSKGTFLSERDIGATAMNYAEYLIAKRDAAKQQTLGDETEETGLAKVAPQEVKVSQVIPPKVTDEYGPPVEGVTTHFNGDLVAYTGNREQLHGALFDEILYLEGARENELGVMHPRQRPKGRTKTVELVHPNGRPTLAQSQAKPEAKADSTIREIVLANVPTGDASSLTGPRFASARKAIAKVLRLKGDPGINALTAELNKRAGVNPVATIRDRTLQLQRWILDKDAGTKFATAPKKDEPRDLIIQHNLTAANLIHADKMGGLAVPSMAVAKADMPLEGFGEITLLGDKNLADPRESGMQVFGGDIYSPRYPTIRYKIHKEKVVDDALKESNKAIGYSDWLDEMKKGGADALSSSNPNVVWTFLKAKGIEPDVRTESTDADRTEELRRGGLEKFFGKKTWDLINDPEFQAAAFKFRGSPARLTADQKENLARHISYEVERAGSKTISRSATRDSLRDQLKDLGLEREFETFRRDLFEKAGAQSRIFKGYTDSGRERLEDHTLANVVAILKKNMKAGEGFSYGPGTVRGAVAPRFKTLDEIRKAKGQLVSKADMEKVKEEVSDAFWKVANMIPGGDKFGHGDHVVQTMVDAAKVGVPRAVRENYLNASGEAQQAMAAFMDKLRTVPTEYFEAKLTRAVGIDEFKVAVVPSDTDPKAIAVLQKHGLKIERYDKSSPADRKRAIAAATEGEGMRFSSADKAKPSKPVTLQIVKNAIPGLPWKQNEDGSFTAKMADGRTLRLQPNANMLDIVEGNRGAFEESARAGGNADAVPVGAYSPFGISAEALISIAEASPGGTIEHEGLHFLWDVALHPKEKAALVKKFGGEEESAYAFAKWLTERNRKPVGVFQKVRDFVRRLVHYFRPTWESTFGEAASGRAARRVAGESTGGERFAAAWHGSPHKFDRFKFDASTVGTGEGAQAYGHGLYFAEDKGVGTNYQNQLRPPTEIDTISMGGVPLYKDGVPVDYGVRGAHTLDKEATATLQEDLLINEQEIKQAFEEMGERGVAERFKEAIEDRIATAKDEYPEIVPAYERILKRFETEQKTAKLKRGEAHLYEVDIPDSVVDRMLDWDKPLSQQPESVLKALERGGVIDSHGTLILDNDIASRYIATGERVYRKIAAKNDVVSKNDIAIDPRGEANASKFLSSLGIPGIKYLDGSSRSKGEGSRNFVVFDDKDVTILTRNGEKVGGSEKAEAIQDLQSQHPETAGSAKFATAPKEEPKESFNGIRGMDSIRKPEREIKKRLGPVLKALPGAEADLLTGLYDRFTADGDAQTTWEAIDKDALATLGVYTKARFLKLKEKGIDIDVPGFRAAVRMVGEAQATNNSTRRTLEAAGPVDPRSREYRAHVASSAKLAGWIMALNGDQTGAAQAFAVAESALSAKDNAAAALETAFGEIGGLGKDEAARLVQMAKTDPQHLATVMEAAFKPGFSEKMNEWRKGAMLFSLRTYGVNFFGNAMKQAVSIAEIPVAAATDKMTNKGERQVYLGEMAAARAGLADFGREAFRDFLTESWAGLRGVETFDKDGHRPYEQRTPAISGPVGKFIRTPFRMLQAADNFFKETAKAQSLYREAYRRGRTQGLTGDALWKKVDDLISIGKESEWTDPRVSGMMAKATKDAQYETFTLQANYDNAGAFGALADFLGKFEKKVPILGPVAGLALPFKNTPANIAWQSFERSPFGFKVARNQALALRSLYKDLAAAPVEEKADIQAKIDSKQRDLSNQVSRATLGTVLFALGTALAAAGLLTGSGPPDWEKKRVWEEEGNLANAINLGGTWYGYDRFEPIAAALSIAGNTPTVASAEGFEDKAAAFAAAMKDAWISKTYFQGLEDFADLVKDPQRYGASFLRDIEGSFVPAFMGQTVEDFDPIVRDRKANALAPITSKIPGLSQNLPPVHTGRGDFAKRVERAGQGLVPAALNPFGGIRAKSATGDPLAAEMTKAGYASRAHANYLEIGVGPKGAKRKERIDLTEPEREMFRKADQSVSERMRQSIESAGWKNLTPDQKLAAFRRNYDRASNSVRDSILPAVHSRLREKLAERKRAN